MAGPFNSTYQPRGFYKYRSWYTQKRPYKTRLPYTFVYKRVTIDKISPPRAAAGLAVMNQDDRTQAINRCYDRFKASLGDNAQIGASIAEWRSTASSISAACLQIYQLAHAVRRGNLRDIRRELREIGASRPNRASKPLKGEQVNGMASRWLEYSFGWKPLVEDVYNGIKVLCTELPHSTITGRATYVGPTRRDGSAGAGYLTTSGIIRVQMKADVTVVNPNLYIDSQLGLINPASIAWELVPWSFVVDWFTNAGQVLGTLSDFAGCTLGNPATTVYATTQSSYIYGNAVDYYSAETVEVARTQKISGPIPAIRPFHGFSVTRGANALALAVQQLLK